MEVRTWRAADKGDNIDKAIEVATESLKGLGGASLTQEPAQKWEFVDLRSLKQKKTRKLIRAYAAQKPKPKPKQTSLIRSDETHYDSIGHNDADNETAKDAHLSFAAVDDRRAHIPQRRYSSPSWAIPGGPISILGAGRVDPFKCLPMTLDAPEIHECFDHFYNVYVPGLFPIDEDGVLSPVAKLWVPEFTSNPLLFQGALLTGATLLSSLTGKDSYRLLRIYHEGQLIKGMMKAFKNAHKDLYAWHEVFICITALTIDGGTIMPLTDDSPFNTPLTGLGWINLRGRLVFNEKHIKALCELVDMRGGLHALRLPHLGTMLSSASILSSTLTVQSPPFPYVRALSRPWQVIMNENGMPLNPNNQGTLLPRLAAFGFGQDIIDISLDLSYQTLKIREYCEKTTGMTKFQTIEYNDMRHEIQHRVISLPELQDKPLYESYRLTLWIYSYAVTFGVPFHTSIRQKLVERLVASLKLAGDDPSWNLLPELLLWILFFGGISAIGLPERVWFVQKTSSQLALLGLKQWAEVKSVLSSFLWLDIASESGGRVLYDEASYLL